jgi:hypothetical protein
VNEVKGDSPLRSDSGGVDRSEAETLDGRGAAAPFLIIFPLGKGHALPYWSDSMQQPNVGDVTIYADIAEVRTLTGAAACNQLLADGWVLLGVYPLTTVGEEYGTSRRERQKQPRDTQQHVRRLVGYVVGRRRE